MARRPTTPRRPGAPTGAGRGAAAPTRNPGNGSRGSGAGRGDEQAARPAGTARLSAEETRRGRTPSARTRTGSGPATRPAASTGDRRPRQDPAPARPAPRPEPAAPEEPRPSGRERVVEATNRFRGMVAGKPWRRRRRAILASLAALALLAVIALGTAVFLPALRLQQVSIEGLGYVEETAVREVTEQHLDDSVLLLPTSSIEEEITGVPGVLTAEVHRDWPDGATVTVTEREAVAQLTRQDGSTAVLDAQGVELPAAAAEGAELVPLTVAPDAEDPDGATEAMSEVLASIPAPLRGAVVDMTASTRSDVSFTLSLEDGGTKTVVWGDTADADLKAEVVQALLGQGGGTIDVSSPVAPVTR